MVVSVHGFMEQPWEDSMVQDDATSNSLPRIGRRGGMKAKRGDLDWHRAKRDHLLQVQAGVTPTNYNWLKSDFARVGKRGPPRLGLPSHWKKSKRTLGLNNLRKHLYSGFRFHPGSSVWTHEGIINKRSPSFWEGAGEGREGMWLHKRSGPLEGEGDGVGLNSVPFMGKRTGEKEEDTDILGERLVRVPREEEEEQMTDPWDFLQLDPNRIWSRSEQVQTGSEEDSSVRNM